MVDQIISQYLFLLVCTVIGRSQVQILASLKMNHWDSKEENFCSDRIISNEHWGIEKSELQQNHCGVFNTGQFLFRTVMVYTGLRLLPASKLLPGNKVQGIQVSRWTTRVTFKELEVSKMESKSKKNWHLALSQECSRYNCENFSCVFMLPCTYLLWDSPWACFQKIVERFH